MELVTLSDPQHHPGIADLELNDKSIDVQKSSKVLSRWQLIGFGAAAR